MRDFEPGDIIAPREHLKDWQDGWALVVSRMEGDGTLYAGEFGGNLVRKFDPISVERFDFVKIPKELLDNPKWHEADFYAEWFDKRYHGWSNGVTWNGWAIPFFEFDEAMKYAKDSQKEGAGVGATTYDPEKDAFVTTRDDPDENEIDEATTIDVEGRGPIKVYSIGGSSWTWTEKKKKGRRGRR